MTATRLIILTGTIVTGLLIALILLRSSEPPAPVKAAPPEWTATSMLPDDFAFRQDDTRWAKGKIGDTEDSILAYGCTIASVAMAASNLTQSEITPWQMQEKLAVHDGFTDRGWLVWDKVTEATDGKISARYYDTPSHEAIKSCMEADSYPVIKIKLYDSIIHWVVIVGTTEDQYLIRDPLVGTSDDPPIELSDRGKDIFGVRCISRNH